MISRLSEKVMKIKLIKWHPSDLDYSMPISDQKAKKAWKLLLSSETFIESVRQIRTKLQIPENGLVKGKHDKWFDNADIKNISVEVESLITKFSLESINSWYFPIMNYILENKLLPPLLSEYDIRIEDNDNPRLIIEINNRLNKKEFNELINREWNEISYLMNQLKRVEIKKISVLELAKQVFDLRKQGLKNREIADILEKQNPKDESGKYNEDYVKTLYNRYKHIFQ